LSSSSSSSSSSSLSVPASASFSGFDEIDKHADADVEAGAS
jgi:hypothetical protein